MLTALLLLLSAEVAPAPPAAAPHVITQPDWVSRPTARDLADLYPKPAAAKKLEGRAVIRCRVDAEGALTDCQVAQETPPEEGFGVAALAMSSRFRMRPMTRDGAPVTGGVVNVPINFRLPSSMEPLNLETALECYGVTSANGVKLTNGEDASIGWREGVQTLGAREHLSASEVDSQLTAARELAETPDGRARAGAQLFRCRDIRSMGQLAALRTAAAKP